MHLHFSSISNVKNVFVMTSHDLSTFISNQTLLHVEIETKPILTVLALLNEHVKTQDERILRLENQITLFAKEENVMAMKKEITSKLEDSEKKQGEIGARMTAISTDMKNLESSMSKTITERFNDALISIQMQIRSATSTLDQQLQMTETKAQENRRRLQEVEATLKQKNIPNNLTQSIESLNAEIALLKETSAKEAEEAAQKASRLREVVASDHDRLKKMMDTVDKHETLVARLMLDMCAVQEAVGLPQSLTEEEKQAFEAIESGSCTPMSRGRSAMGSRVLMSTNDLGSFEADVHRVTAEFKAHEENVILAMNAIADELQMIRDFGQGLARIPQLKLKTVVPPFFSDSKYEKPVLETVDDEPSDHEDEDQKREKDDGVHEALVKTGNKDEESEEPVVMSQIDEEDIMRRLRVEMDIDGMRKTFEEIVSAQEEVVSAIDRKIDRDYVERLFDKFRIMIHGLNDRVRELASLTGDYATRDELEIIAKIIKRIPNDTRPVTAMKKGCLFCGKPGRSVAGQISPRTAAMAGRPSVGRVVNEGNGAEFVYGEGQAFRREEFQSLPHLETIMKQKNSDANQ